MPQGEQPPAAEAPADSSAPASKQLCRAQLVIPLEGWVEVQEVDLMKYARAKNAQSSGRGYGAGWKHVWLTLTVNALTAYENPSKTALILVLPLRQVPCPAWRFCAGALVAVLCRLL